MQVFRFLHSLPLLLLILTLGGCGRDRSPAEGRLVIDYWEKWTGFEGDAMRAVVDDFNRSQDEIFVRLLPVSQIERKVMLATAAGRPPDVAGLRSGVIPVFAENNALQPLDARIEAAGINRDDYIPIYWDLMQHRGFVWALPTTPAVVALHYNKRLFREAGLDPENPPRTIAELEAANERLLKLGPDGRIAQIGHVPTEPGWWAAMWPYWFHGDMVDEDGAVALDNPGALAAFEWLRSYPERFGAGRLLAMRDGFGNFASPQNAFFTGRVAMVLQGPWMYNFIQNFAPPDFEWGVAPFPSLHGDREAPVTFAEADVLVIPVGATNPEAAFRFIQFVNERENMEKLCLLQRKFSPLRETSPGFFVNHPNPYIETFVELAFSPNARVAPPVTYWTEYTEHMGQAIDRVLTRNAAPAATLREVEREVERLAARKERRWDLVADRRLAEWREALE
jgi:multiple sugar transport system substrate-binding protein